MPRATTKTELIDSANAQWDKLWKLIDALPDPQAVVFNFPDDPKLKEAHWQRDKNLRDILVHLYEWHELLLGWTAANLGGETKPFLPEPYTWKTYGDMNVKFWEKHQATSYDHPIIEDGVLLKDKVYLEKKLRAEDMIKGNIIELVPATLDDKQNIYDWCFHSETTKSHSGLPDYPENPIATWEEFFDAGYVDYFFTGSEPDKGRGFMILHDGKAVGFISYCSFHLKPNKSELDIWMNSEANCGKGFGFDAIVSLGAYLYENMGINELIMRPSARNERAIKAYTKAGFEKTDKLPSDYLMDEYIPLYGEGDYGADGTVNMVKIH